MKYILAFIAFYFGIQCLRPVFEKEMYMFLVPAFLLAILAGCALRLKDGDDE